MWNRAIMEKQETAIERIWRGFAAKGRDFSVSWERGEGFGTAF
jgi:hypothetical protein